MTKRLTKGVAGAIGMGAVACAACCAPLVAPFVVPPVAALFAGSGAALAISGEVAIGAAVVAGVLAFTGLGWWQARRRADASRATAATCDCPPENGCTPDACALPAPGMRG